MIYNSTEIAGHQIDVLQQTYMTKGQDHTFHLKVNYTDTKGNALSARITRVKTTLNSESLGLMVGVIAYESKVLDPSRSSVEQLYNAIQRGVGQVKDRSKYVDAAVLVINSEAWEALMNSNKKDDALKVVGYLDDIKNERGERKAFLRIEQGLLKETQKAYGALKDKVKKASEDNENGN